MQRKLRFFVPILTIEVRTNEARGNSYEEKRLLDVSLKSQADKVQTGMGITEREQRKILGGMQLSD